MASFKFTTPRSNPSTSFVSGIHLLQPSLVLPTPRGSVAILGNSVVDPEDATSAHPHRHRGKMPPVQEVHVFMNLLMSVIGAGMLSLPFTFVVVPSIAQAVAMVVVVGVCMALTAHALLHVHTHVAQEEEIRTFVGAGKNIASYRSMGIRVAGERFGNAVSVVMAVGIFGGCVGGIRIVKDMMPHIASLLYDALATSSFESLAASRQSLLQTALLCGIFVLLVFPLCALKKLSGLKIPNYFGFAFSLLLVAAVVYRSCTLPIAAAVAIESAVISSTAPQFARFSQSVSIYSYAFTMQLNLLPLFVQLRGNFNQPLRHSTARMTRCISSVTGLCMVLYIIFGIFAARLYGSEIQGNVLVNMQNDSFMQIPLIAVLLTVLLSFPPLFHPGRVIVEELISQRPAAELGWRSRVLTAAVLLLGELFVALWVPGIEVVFALVGASTTVLICYVFPVVMFTRLYPWRQRGASGYLWCASLWLIVASVASMGVRTIVFLLSGA